MAEPEVKLKVEKLPDEQQLFLFLRSQGVPRKEALILARQLYAEFPHLPEGWESDKAFLVANPDLKIATWNKYVLEFMDYADKIAEDYAAAETQYKRVLGGYLSPESQYTLQQKIALGKAQFEPTDMAQATEVAQRKALETEKAWYGAQEMPPTYAQATAPVVEGLRELSPALRGYYEQELPDIYAQAGMPETRAKWWAEKTKYVPETQGVGGADWENMPQAEIAQVEQGHKDWEAEQARRQGLPDPWEEFLKRYPFLQKYQALSPKERGFYPGQYAPPARTLRY